MNLLDGDCWRERSKRFPFFDHGIDAVAHRRISRVRQDAAVPQGAGTKLHATPVPRHHASVSNESASLDAGLLQAATADNLQTVPEFSQSGFNLSPGVCRTVERYGHPCVDYFSQF